MKILVTGAQGFIGKHLVLRLKEFNHEVLTFVKGDSDLKTKTSQADFVFHLAGVNRTENLSAFKSINVDLTDEITRLIEKSNRIIPVVFSSSTQALKENPYGISKKQAEDLLMEWHKETQNPVYIFRLPGVFGKWSKPYYNTVVATFIDQLHQNKPLSILDEDAELDLIYIDRVIEQFISSLDVQKSSGLQKIDHIYNVTVGELAELLKMIHQADTNQTIPQQSTPLIKDLYSTYISLKPMNQLKKMLESKEDDRGSFTEILKTLESGQFSVNITKPGIVKGNHYHHHKHEKFLVVSGQALIQLRNLSTNEKLDITVDAEKKELIDIPPGVVHSIKNVGEQDLVTLMWANELFDVDNPDTIYKQV